MESTNKYEFNRNEKQSKFNEIKGFITEKNDGEAWCSITLNVGHENPRFVNLSLKKTLFDSLNEKFLVGDKVRVLFYVTSHFKKERWYTSACVLHIMADLPD